MPSQQPYPPMYGPGPVAPNIQQASNGQYQVVPAMSPMHNNGHSGLNPYEFIVSPNTAPAKGNVLSNKNPLMLAAALCGGLIVLIIIAAVVMQLLTPKGPSQSFVGLVQRQQEIIRVATKAQQQTTSQDTANFVANVLASATSNQQATLAYMSANGMKFDTKTIGLDKDPQTDTALAAALTANNYDSAVTDNLTGQLDKYEVLLQSTYKQTSGPKAKALLQSSFNGADLLLQQGQALQKSFGE